MSLPPRQPVACPYCHWTAVSRFPKPRLWLHNGVMWERPSMSRYSAAGDDAGYDDRTVDDLLAAEEVRQITKGATGWN